jgi:hypothetical protein
VRGCTCGDRKGRVGGCGFSDAEEINVPRIARVWAVFTASDGTSVCCLELVIVVLLLLGPLLRADIVAKLVIMLLNLSGQSSDPAMNTLRPLPSQKKACPAASFCAPLLATFVYTKHTTTASKDHARRRGQISTDSHRVVRLTLPLPPGDACATARLPGPRGAWGSRHGQALTSSSSMVKLRSTGESPSLFSQYSHYRLLRLCKRALPSERGQGSPLLVHRESQALAFRLR